MAGARTNLSFLDTPGPIAFAHRGGNEAAPENTFEAFQAAASLGYQYLETDVHLTRGGELVAFHDASLARVCGRERAIARLSVAERKAARICYGGKHYAIPLLDDLLEHFPNLKFNIDAKAGAAVAPLAAALKKHRALDRVCVVSFSHANVRRLRALLPGVCSAMSSAEVARLWLSAKLPFDRFLAANAHCVELPLRHRLQNGRHVTVITKRLITKAHARGLQVHAWTINNAADMHHLLDLGIDGIMTDKPALLKAVLTARQQWHHG